MRKNICRSEYQPRKRRRMPFKKKKKRRRMGKQEAEGGVDA
jgi:hypothetical protein